MKYTDVLMHDYSDAAFQAAFRAYFEELGHHLENWEGLFQEMMAAADTYTCLRRNEAGEVVGFIQFTPLEMSSWFFSARCGFIREFWIRPDLRCQGHGSDLLRQAEAWFREQGCSYVLLTTDTAPDFYRRQGYSLQQGLKARNKDDVYAKVLT